MSLVYQEHLGVNLISLLFCVHSEALTWTAMLRDGGENRITVDASLNPRLCIHS